MEDSNSLDLTESTENRVHVPFVFTRDHADWLTTDGQASFARGTGASVAQSQEEAYAAMTMKDTLSSPFGLDSARPTLGLSDVRAQPSKRDEGYFFPRVRTPCGHDAQVIIEGREIQSDGGEKDKDNPTTNQTKPTTAHRPRLHHQVVFPLY